MVVAVNVEFEWVLNWYPELLTSPCGNLLAGVPGLPYEAAPMSGRQEMVDGFVIVVGHSGKFDMGVAAREKCTAT